MRIAGTVNAGLRKSIPARTLLADIAARFYTRRARPVCCSGVTLDLFAFGLDDSAKPFGHRPMASAKARIGCIGAGWWATSNHIPLLAARDDVELTGVCRLGQAELDRVRKQFGFRFATEDY